MKQTIIDKIKNLFAHKAIVLMYHRIAERESDVWELAVSAYRFEQHLKILKKMRNVVPLQELANSVSSRRLLKNSIAITFDDGYIDNFKVAKPLLEKYGIPATFFITSGYIENETEFWWDELEHIILFTERLPPVFSMVIKENAIVFELKKEIYLTEEILHRQSLWKACTEAPPTLRAKLFYKLWEQLKPLPYPELSHYLEMIRKWADVPSLVRPDFRTVTAMELKELASGKLFTIGAHTLTHPALAYHSADFQKKELNENRKFLQELTGQNVGLLAYPYGNYNEDTLQTASDAGFSAAFTTEEGTIKSRSYRYKLGRFQVKNLTGTEFNDQLKKWSLH
jgi:peptidoglycan/xylan/chitin deacetylase (PgdA/CDA1 family)